MTAGSDIACSEGILTYRTQLQARGHPLLTPTAGSAVRLQLKAIHVGEDDDVRVGYCILYDELASPGLQADPLTLGSSGQSPGGRGRAKGPDSDAFQGSLSRELKPYQSGAPP